MQISRSLGRAAQDNDADRVISAETLHAEWAEVQAAQREPARFRPLYDRYYEPVFRYLYHRTQDEDLSADLCAQVFLKALQSLGEYAFRGVPFAAWLFRIAANEVALHYRQTQKYRIVSVEEGGLLSLADEIEPDDHAEQLRTLLPQAMQALKIADMELIEMRFFEQRPFRDIADILGITESNAKVKTYRTLERLKKILMTLAQQPSAG